MLRTLCLLGLAVCQYQLSFAQLDARTLVNKMYAAVDNAKKYSFTMYSKERFGDDYVEKKMLFHIQESPKKVYMKDLDEGVELLYVTGWNDGKAFINPNGFPWVNVSLKITDGRVTKESHHLVTSAGISFTVQLMRTMEERIKANGQRFEDFFTYRGETTWNGKSYYQLALVNKDYKYISHTVDRDEDLDKMCGRLCVPSFSVMAKNMITRGPVSKGKVLSVPNAFAKEVLIFVDKQSFLPSIQAVYDDKGLFEYYEFRDLNTNPSFQSNEFTTDCSSYGF